ncbi:MAG: hypothetical protein JSV51_00715 [Candidatus Bathyarchaeota archaeon]|nr:MAG: hypothetical protein JSV51_00715 [Candidatus Bathyarchaeota archaeon]
MNESSLREVERRTYMAYHQDGLLDIFVGVYVLLFGLGILLMTTIEFSTWFVIPAIFPAVMMPIWISVKKRITMPRIGYVKFGYRGANKMVAIFLGLTVAGLGAFMLFGLGAFMGQGWALTLRNLIIPNGMIIVGILAAAISSLFAYTMGLKRLYAYGILVLTSFLTGHFTTIPFEYVLLAIGLVIIINGFVLLTRFIRKYPLAPGDETNAEESL